MMACRILFCFAVASVRGLLLPRVASRVEQLRGGLLRGGAGSEAAGVVVDESRVIGEGSYGVVVAAADESGGEFVAKRAKRDDLSRKYLATERLINEKLRDVEGLARYVGAAVGVLPDAGFFEAKTCEYLVFERVRGGRDAASYVEDGSCGVDALAAALGLDACAFEDECSVFGDEGCAVSDPESARSGAANLAVASRVLAFLTEALAGVNGRGVAHRDVKASNVLVSPATRRLALIDLGSAMDVASRAGYDPRRSPVSPRYCPPEQFCDPSAPSWESFDAYGAGFVALRVLLSPALRSDNDVDAFNVEFKAAGHDLDAWLANKLATTALPEKLLAPLAALGAYQGRTRVIRRRFNVGVLEATPETQASALVIRPER